MHLRSFIRFRSCGMPAHSTSALRQKIEWGPSNGSNTFPLSTQHPARGAFTRQSCGRQGNKGILGRQALLWIWYLISSDQFISAPNLIMFWSCFPGNDPWRSYKSRASHSEPCRNVAWSRSSWHTAPRDLGNPEMDHGTRKPKMMKWGKHGKTWWNFMKLCQLMSFYHLLPPFLLIRSHPLSPSLSLSLSLSPFSCKSEAPMTVPSASGSSRMQSSTHQIWSVSHTTHLGRCNFNLSGSHLKH